MKGLDVALNLFDSLDDLFLENLLAVLDFGRTFQSRGALPPLEIHEVVLESRGISSARGWTELLGIRTIVVCRLSIFHRAT